MFSISTIITSPTGQSQRSRDLGGVARRTSKSLSKVLRDVSTQGLLELVASCCDLSEFRSEGSKTRLEDSWSGSFPCLLHFSPIGERDKPVCHVDDVEEEMSDQWNNRFSRIALMGWLHSITEKYTYILIIILILQSKMKVSSSIMVILRIGRTEPTLWTRSKRTNDHTSWFWGDKNIEHHSQPMGQRPSPLSLP